MQFSPEATTRDWVISRLMAVESPFPTIPVSGSASHCAPAFDTEPSSSSAFNELWFRKAPRRRLGELQPIPAFFHPLDSLGRWNLLYGPKDSPSINSWCRSAQRRWSVRS